MAELIPPTHLPDDVAAVWVETNGRTDHPHEGPDFEAYCGQVARLRDAQQRLQREGLVIADPKGNPVPHPAIAIERAAQAEIRSWGAQFKPRRRR